MSGILNRNFSPLENFAYSAPKVKPATSLFPYMGWEFDKNWSVEVGTGFTVQSLRSTVFSASQITDSLIGFDSPGNGQLDQIVIVGFDIGGEQQTHSMNLRKENFLWNYLTIPVRFARYIPTTNRDVKLLAQAGTTLQYGAAKSPTGGSVVLLDSGRDYAILNEEDLMISEFWMNLYFAFGYQWEMQHRQGANFTLKLFAAPQLIGPVSADSPISLRRFNAGLSLGFNKFF